MNQANTRSRRGMTLVEVVVAMTVVIIVSFAALSTVLFAAESFENVAYRQYAVNEADNVLSCLQSDDPEEALKFVYGISSVEGGFPASFASGETWRLAVYIPSDYYTMKEEGTPRSGSVTARIDRIAEKNVEKDAESYDTASNCSVKVVVYIENRGGIIRVDTLIAEALYIKGGSTALRRAYYLTSGLTLDASLAQAVESGTEASGS